MDDYGDTLQDAFRVTPGTNLTGFIESENDLDVFAVELFLAQTISIDIAPIPGADPLEAIYLEIADANVIVGEVEFSSEDNDPTNVTFTAPISGTYYFAVSSWFTESGIPPLAIGNYAVSVNLVPNTTDVHGDYFLNATPATGTGLNGGIESGTIHNSDDSDWFEVFLGAGERIVAAVQSVQSGNTLETITVELADNDGNVYDVQTVRGPQALATIDFTAPSFGAYFIIVSGVDPIPGNANATGDYNVQFNINPAPLGPDLAVDLTLRNTPDAFTPAEVDLIFRNIGDETANGARYGIYLSTDATIDTTDIELQLQGGVNLAPGSTTFSQQFDLPGDLATGTYYIGAIADPLDAVSESNEQNNASAVASFNYVAPPPPDLEIGGPLTLIPSSDLMLPGDPFEVGFTVTNLSSGPAAATDYQVLVDGLDVGTMGVLPALAPGESQQIIGTFSVPDLANNDVPGPGVVEIFLDPSLALGDTDPMNNSAELPGNLNVFNPELDEVGGFLDPAPIANGESIIGVLQANINDFDAYAIDADEGDIIEFTIAPDSSLVNGIQLLNYEIRGPNVEILAKEFRTDPFETVQVIAPDDGNVTIAMIADAGLGFGIEFTGGFEVTARRFVDLPDDHGDFQITATDIAEGQIIDGVIETASDVDFFRFTTNGATNVQAIVTTRNANGDELLTPVVDILNVIPDTPTTAFVQITGGGDTGGYTLELRQFSDSIVGTNEADTLTGTDFAETITALARDDRVTALDGDDVIYGGDGLDSISGGEGNDEIYGGARDDLIRGGAGDDTIDGGTFFDLIFADAGNDLVYGGQAGDTVLGRDGNDEIYGGENRDNLLGEAGNDVIYGGADFDTLNGGTGTDVLYGGDAPDTMRGGDNDDLMFGGFSNDVMFGDSGNDTLYGDAGKDNQLGGTGADLIYGGAGADKQAGGIGDDTLYGDGDADRLSGEAGNDLIFGGDGIDLVFGGGDDDTAFGGDARDVILGRDGDDEIHGDDGDDKLYGEAGNDQLWGGADTNFLFGGAGEDSAYGGEGRDIIRLGTETDVAYGGYGDDNIRGEAGDDTLYGDFAPADGAADIAGVHDDFLLGEAGNDLAYGGFDNDRVDGGADNDILFGGVGDDSLFGNIGNDAVSGDDGDDLVRGGGGNDFLNGGTGDDTMIGEAGVDTFFFELGDGADEILGFGAGEEIQIRGTGLPGPVTLTQLSLNQWTVDYGATDTIEVRTDSGIALELNTNVLIV